MTFRPSPARAARYVHQVRDAANGMFDLSLGDPPAHRSALAEYRARPASAPNVVSISAAGRKDLRGGNETRAERRCERAASLAWTLRRWAVRTVPAPPLPSAFETQCKSLAVGACVSSSAGGCSSLVRRLRSSTTKSSAFPMTVAEHVAQS
jgi:hypothetical protein